MGKRNYRVEIDWSDFEGTHAVLPICVRSPAVQLRKFEETIKAIAPRVQHLHVMICDALDRYNLGDDATDPYAESLHRADVWMETHMHYIEKHIPSWDLTRWDTIAADPTYSERLQKVNELYEKNEEVRTLIDSMTDFYVVQKAARRGEQGFMFDEAKERKNSTAYLLEEMAGNIVARYEFFNDAPELYWGLYVSDTEIFKRAAGPEYKTGMIFPVTCPIRINLLPAPVPTGDLPGVLQGKERTGRIFEKQSFANCA